MELTVDVIDAFTDTRFKGNSAAVIITEKWLNDELMQSIATENNLSETAFLTVNPTQKIAHIQHISIRWFSPITEIAFCGHATLASAFVVFKKYPTLQKIIFSADAVGELSVTQTDTGLIQMDFPNTLPTPVQAIPIELTKGLSIAPLEVYKNQQAYFVVYPSEHDIIDVTCDNEMIRKLAPLDVVVTAKSDHSANENSDKKTHNNSQESYDFISRYFWPANGGDEDSVTGSVHTGLAPLWFKKLKDDNINKETLTAYQASARGGILYCSLKNNRVVIAGHAVQYLKGIITL